MCWLPRTGRGSSLGRAVGDATHPSADLEFDRGLGCVLDGLAARPTRCTKSATAATGLRDGLIGRGRHRLPTPVPGRRAPLGGPDAGPGLVPGIGLNGGVVASASESEQGTLGPAG